MKDPSTRAFCSAEEFLQRTRKSYEHRLFIHPKPAFCIWEVTNACNLRCRHCFLSEPGKRLVGELPKDRALRLIDDFVEAGVKNLLLSGGEPLLRKDLLEIVERAARSMSVSINTNGIYLPEMAQDLRNAGLSMVQVSLDGATPETHDLLRGKGSFKRTMRGLMKCRESGFERIFIMTTMHRANVGELHQLVKMATDMGIGLRTITFVPTGRGAAIAEYALSSEERRKVCEEISRWREQGFDVGSDDPCTHAVDAPAAGEAAGAPHFSVGCHAGITRFAVTPEGKLLACPGIRIPAGDLTEERLSDIWATSPQLRMMRDRETLHGKCGHCEYRYTCGGCRAAGFQHAHDQMGADELCWRDPLVSR